jgi:hypothetical protein
MNTPDTTKARNYPLPRPESDKRFSFGLFYDLAQLLQAHGYPPLTGRDLVELRQALFGLLYAKQSVPGFAGDLVHAFPPIDHPSIRTDPQPRCGAASERMALFAADVTCPPCLALMAGQSGGDQAFAPLDVAFVIHDLDGTDSGACAADCSGCAAIRAACDHDITPPTVDPSESTAMTQGAAIDAADQTRWLEPSLGPCPQCPCPTDVHSVGLGCVLCDCTWGREAER